MKSNFTFRGPKISIREHWTGEWEVLESNSGKLLYLVSSQEKALEVYDRENSEENFDIMKKK